MARLEAVPETVFERDLGSVKGIRKLKNYFWELPLVSFENCPMIDISKRAHKAYLNCLLL